MEYMREVGSLPKMYSTLSVSSDKINCIVSKNISVVIAVPVFAAGSLVA